MRIAVYSGSFDPLHKGHQAIMEFLTSDREFDWVYLVVSPQSPFKSELNNLTALDRYNAAVDAVCRHPQLHVWVDDIELHMDPPHYTCRTLDALQQREPENDFTLIIGADNLESFRRWQHYDRILLEYGIEVFPREGYDSEKIREELLSENPEYRIHLIDAPLVTISSTLIREGRIEGKDMSEYLM